MMPLAIGLIACVVGSAGSRFLNPLPVSQISPLSLTLLYVAALGAAAALIHQRNTWRSHAATAAPGPPVDPRVPAPGPEPVGEPAAPAEDRTADTLLDRVRTVLSERHPEIVIVDGSVRFDNDTAQVNAFSLRTTKPSGFSDGVFREKIFQRVSESIPGRWNMTAEPQRDMIHLRTKLPFPAAVATPMPDRIALNKDDALDIYIKGLALSIGVNELLESIDLDIQAFPHWLFIGGTGSGKSVFMRGAVIEPFRAAGAMIFLGDGKGTDYTQLIGLPNIVTVSQTTADHIRMVRLCADELRARRADAQAIQFSRNGQTPFQRPPIVMLLDEFATMMANVKGEYGKQGVESFLADLKFLVRVGREFKVHVGIASQEAYRDIIDGQLMGNLQLRVSLGPPEDKTISEVFPDKLQAQAKRIGSGINKKRDIGRGLAFMASDSDEIVVEFQSYYGHTPNPSKPPPPILAAAHEAYREQVSDRIPRLHPRLWWQVESPDYAADLESIYATPAVLLDNGRGEPDPTKFIYDPLHPSYQGLDRDAATPPIPTLSELSDGATYAPLPPKRTTRPSLDDDQDIDDDDQPAFDVLDTADYEGDPFDNHGAPPPDWATGDDQVPDEPTRADTTPEVDDDDDPPPFDVDPEPRPEPTPAPLTKPTRGRVPPPHPSRRPNTGTVNI
ncbi:hypothetical protein [Gordonia malaquae]|uniref:hypothetical protein n=1 Tax=Gordonia malaquae TaxID=410332 RepID=UPI00301B0FD2